MIKVNRVVAQEGSALIISLVFLLLITLVAVASVQRSTLEERMAGNLRDQNNAFQAAEAALRVAETYLGQATLGSFAGSSGRYLVCSDPASTDTECVKPAWNSRNSTGWVALSGLSHVSGQPQYILEKFQATQNPEGDLGADEPIPPYEMYRVTSRGFGVSDFSMVVLQTTFRRN